MPLFLAIFTSDTKDKLLLETPIQLSYKNKHLK